MDAPLQASWFCPVSSMRIVGHWLVGMPRLDNELSPGGNVKAAPLKSVVAKFAAAHEPATAPTAFVTDCTETARLWKESEELMGLWKERLIRPAAAPG